jgi:RNA polymerase sigma factor (sigma-70 family)
VAAAQLFLSTKTIEKHLGSAYRKLGLHSRAELARLFGAQKLALAPGAPSAGAPSPRPTRPKDVGVGLGIPLLRIRACGRSLVGDPTSRRFPGEPPAATAREETSAPMPIQRQLRLVRTPNRDHADRPGVPATARAAAGDQQAWQELVTRYTPAIRAAARGFGIRAADVDDVVQTTWLAAVRYLHRVQRPESVGAWLLTTTRREALRTLQRGLRETLTDSPLEPAVPDDQQPDALLLDRERRHVLHRAIDRLSDRQRGVLHSLLATPETSYADLSKTLEMPIGSIGPTRDRGLARLRQTRSSPLSTATTPHNDDVPPTRLPRAAAVEAGSTRRHEGGEA